MRKGGNFVVGAAQLECPDGLKVFRLKVELAGIGGWRALSLYRRVGKVNLRFDQPGADGNTAQSGLGFVNVSEGDQTLEGARSQQFLQVRLRNKQSPKLTNHKEHEGAQRLNLQELPSSSFVPSVVN